MNTFMESIMKEAFESYDLAMMKIEAFMEASTRTFAINYNEAELKVMTESGTDADLKYLYEEAENSFSDRIRAALIKIKESLLEFLAKVQEKLLDFVTSVKVKLSLEKLEKKIKSIPLFAKKNIEVTDNEAAIEVCDKTISIIDKMAAKVAGGQNISDDEIERLEEKFYDDHEKAVKNGAAHKIKMTASAAVIMFKDKMKKAPAYLKERKNIIINFFESVIAKVKGVADEGAAKIKDQLSRLARLRAKVERTEVNDLVTDITDTYNSINSESVGSVDLEVKPEETPAEAKETKESAENYMDPNTILDNWDSVMNNLEVPASVFNIPDLKPACESAEEEETPVEEKSTFESLMGEIDKLF